MDNLTIGIIYAIKNGMKGPCENIVSFLSAYTGTPREYYDDVELKKILQQSFIDYLKTADNPSFDVWQFFEAKRHRENYREIFPKHAKEQEEKLHFLDDDSEAIISALRMTAVQKDGKYINGFYNYKLEGVENIG